MQLATITQNGHPTLRTVSVGRDLRQGLNFFTNLDSPKAQDIQARPAVEVHFFWPELGQQVRASGTTRPLPPQVCDQVFQMQPREQQLTAHITARFGQSKEVDQETLERALLDVTAELRHHERIPRPERWGGFHIDVVEWEFWQARPDLLHQRLQYRQSGNTWLISQLVP